MESNNKSTIVINERRGKRPRCNGKVFYHEHSSYKGNKTINQGSSVQSNPLRKEFTTKDVEKYFLYLWGKKFKEISKEDYIAFKKVGAHVEVEVEVAS